MAAWRNGVPVTLTAHEFKLLKYFTDNIDRVLTRELLLNEVWGYNSYPHHPNSRQPNSEASAEA